MYDKKTAVIAIIAIIVVLLLVVTAPAIIRYAVHREIKTVKQETVQEIKKLDREQILNGTAKAIHDLKTFKGDLKVKVDSLDSAGKK